MNINVFLKKHQNGQSLVEFILIVPLFFIVLSAVNLYLNQKIKFITEQSAYESLSLSDSHFDIEERQSAQWNASQMKTESYNNEILNQSLNGSLFFKHSVDTKNGVFVDKKYIQSKKTTTCSQNPVYELNSTKKGEFDFSVCANGAGFEAKNFSYQKTIENFKPTTQKHKGHSLYYPSDQFSWNHRAQIVSDAVQNFQKNIQMISFSKKYASLLISYDDAQFNSNCLMNPGKQTCSLPTLETKWRRTAFNSANQQVLECLLEASAKCLAMLTPVLIAGCIGEKASGIISALSMGLQAPECPILNKILDVRYHAGLTISDTNTAKITLQESLLRNQ